MPISDYQENLVLCKSCVHRDCCGDTLKVANVWASMAKNEYLDRHRFALQIQCVNFMDAGLVQNAIKAYKNQNKREEK